MFVPSVYTLVSRASTYLLSLAGIEKEVLKALVEEWGLIYLWNVARGELVILPIIVGVPAALLMERIYGRIRQRAFPPAFWQGVWCRILNAAILSGALGGALRLIHMGYDVYLPFLQLRALDGMAVEAQFAAFFIAGDFLRYANHRVRHLVPAMWAFHAVHHSDNELSPGTGLRDHIGDRILSSIINAGPLMLLGGDPAVTFALSFAHQFWAFFIHIDAPITLGPVGRIIVSPMYHRIHHSAEPRHWDRNFGEVLTVWDRMFGTATFDYEREFECGVAYYAGANPPSGSLLGYVRTWVWLTVRPFRDLAKGAWRSRGRDVYET